MPEKLDIDRLAATNPKVDIKKVRSALAQRRTLERLGIISTGPKCLSDPPFGRTKPQAKKHMDRLSFRAQQRS